MTKCYKKENKMVRAQLKDRICFRKIGLRTKIKGIEWNLKMSLVKVNMNSLKATLRKPSRIEICRKLKKA